MIIFLYTDIKYEYQAINCIKSLTNKITDDVKLVYYTIGFDSQFEFKNLVKLKIDIKPEYPTYHYYKADLSLLTMTLFPNEHYIFTDADIIFSKRFNPSSLKNIENYPIACYGPHEFPFIWTTHLGEKIIHNELPLMNYFNVTERSQRYVPTCFYTFNPNCKDFFEEYISICKNKYLMDRRDIYFPFPDETPFNICLWKRGATKNYGFAFVNTHKLETIIEIENGISNKYYENRDTLGANWEWVGDANDIMFYHGLKDNKETQIILEYLLNS